MVFEEDYHFVDFDIVLPDYHEISWWPIVGPLVRACKPVQGES